MYSILEAAFSTWSNANTAKFHVMNSITGRSITRRVDENVFEQCLGRRLRAFLREIDRVLHHGFHFVVELVQRVFRELAFLFHVHPQKHDGITLLPLLELLLRAVRSADRV